MSQNGRIPVLEIYSMVWWKTNWNVLLLFIFLNKNPDLGSWSSVFMRLTQKPKLCRVYPVKLKQKYVTELFATIFSSLYFL